MTATLDGYVYLQDSNGASSPSAQDPAILHMLTAPLPLFQSRDSVESKLTCLVLRLKLDDTGRASLEAEDFEVLKALSCFGLAYVCSTPRFAN